MSDTDALLPASENNSPAPAVPESRGCVGVKFFILVMSGVIFMQSLVFSVEPATITTIQKEYGLTSFQTGVWFSCFEVGEIIAGLLVTYFSGRSHKPRLLAINLAISSVCCLAHALPHFIISSHTHDPASDSLGGDLCGYVARNSCSDASGSHEGPGPNDVTTVLVIYCVASFFWGAAWGPTHGLAVVYIDDNMVDKSKTSIYMGAYYAMGYIGPLAGYGLAALTLIFPVNLHATVMKPTDANWIGAWWLGYVISASIMAALTIPLLLFPRSMSQPRIVTQSCYDCFNSKPEGARLLPAVPTADGSITSINTSLQESATATDEDEDSCKEELPTLKRFFPVILLLVRSPLYVLIVMVSAVSSWMDAGYFSYLPKYLESQFHQSSALADVQSGVSWSVVSTIATIAGGWLVSHFHLSVKQCTVVVLCSCACGAILLGVAVLFDCQEHPVKDRAYLVPACACNATEYNPVCLGGNLSYYSPCHAGCRNLSKADDGTILEYLSCGMDGSSSAVQDVCHSSCNGSAYAFLVFVAFAYGIPALSQMACITIVLRSVRKELRAFGIGIMCEAMSLFAWVPAPMIYGLAIDGTCSLWSGMNSCSGQADDANGDCLEYNNESFRYRLHFLTDGALTTSCLFALTACILAHRWQVVAENRIVISE